MSSSISIPNHEIEIQAIRSQGAGGQNVNKVSTAIHLRFNIHTSSLSQVYKDALLNLHDRRISADGVITIKAQQFRTQEQNREDALTRLRELIQRAAPRKKRKATTPSKSSQNRRIEQKKRQGKLKALRRAVD